MGTEPIAQQLTYQHPRRWPRYKLDIPVRVVAQKGDIVKIVQGRGNELNEGGLCLFAGIELSVGESVFVEFTPVYSGAPLRARCIVRDRSEYRYGVEFAHDSKEDVLNNLRVKTVLQAYGVPL